MEHYFDIAFAEPVRALQQHKDAREHYEKMRERWPAPDALGTNERAHIGARDSFYLATVGADGWPYVQHRGGDVGFVTVLDDTRIGWLERRGNRQYVGTGNIVGDDRVALIMVDYPARTRLKLYGHARYHPEPDAGLVTALGGANIREDGAVVVDVVSFDWNCPKYITPRFTSEQVRATLAERDERITSLEFELVRMRARVEGLACD